MFAQAARVKSISNDEFISLIKNNPKTVVLDVRTPEELKGPLGKLDNVINIPIQELSRRLNELNKYKDDEIIVICRTQNRSAAAAEFLNRNGFKTKYVFGGMTEYKIKNKKE